MHCSISKIIFFKEIALETCRLIDQGYSEVSYCPVNSNKPMLPHRNKHLPLCRCHTCGPLGVQSQFHFLSSSRCVYLEQSAYRCMALHASHAQDRPHWTGKQNVAPGSLHRIPFISAFFRCCLRTGPNKSHPGGSLFWWLALVHPVLCNTDTSRSQQMAQINRAVVIWFW